MNKPVKTPEIHVGILRSGGLEFEFLHPCHVSGPGKEMEKSSGFVGEASAELRQGKIIVKQEGKPVVEGQEIYFDPLNAQKEGFRIKDVLIGIGFHWEQNEDQLFPGSLLLTQVDGEIQVINRVSVEKYLASVISSEMRGDSFPALLKAHAIISRSWLLAQIEKQDQLLLSGEKYDRIEEGNEEYIRWYDREDHDGFHVCADDHCQRYQGITKAGNPEVLKAVADTCGEVLEYEGKICDARFSKCCGGVTEEFQHCWEDQNFPYLLRVDDNPKDVAVNKTDLKVESNARKFILSAPEAFCNTSDPELLGQVLNDYDHSARDFYRWELSYTQEEISALIREKSGKDFGAILELVPVERGESGRLVRLRIVGSKLTMVIGKELEIRRWLSTSHLYSAAFVAEAREIKDGVPGVFVLRGAGWGHGVGLCQIGAAVMAQRGYIHGLILSHYFKGAQISKRYE